MAHLKEDYAFDELLEDLSKAVREAYIECRRTVETRRTGIPSFYNSCARWDGKRTRKGDRTQVQKPVWPKIVRFALQHGLDPVRYVQDMLFLLEAQDICPVPTQLCGPWAERTYFSAFPKQHSQQMIDDALRAQRVALACKITDLDGVPGWTFDRIRRYVITDPGISLSALFRYCCAVEANFTDIAKQYREPAIHQYTLHMPQYDAAWGDWIPEDIRAAGRRRKEYIDRLNPRFRKQHEAGD